MVTALLNFVYALIAKYRQKCVCVCAQFMFLFNGISRFHFNLRYYNQVCVFIVAAAHFPWLQHYKHDGYK